ncbi:MAG: tetratricopeptide repeat protein [Cyanobacteriota bacterium]|nr:tetratricopeptide repeat protein [Cyanobacteriota bacterium]
MNANSVLFLDADEECRDAIEYLIEVFDGDPEKFHSPYYNHITSFYYALSRIIYSRHSPLDSIKEELIERILSLQKYDGLFGDELKTALAICSLLNCGFDGNNLTSAVDFLIQAQQSDGSWRRIPWYREGDRAVYGSAELTTGFCLEALVRYRDLKLQQTQQPSHANGFFRLVRSREWWLYKIAPLLSIACAETLFLQLPPTAATLTTLTALISIASVAAYGYLLNDICDIEADQKANKPNAAANLQPWQRLLLCLLFISTGFVAPLLAHLGTVPLALLAANYLLPTLYSVPPLRLKERGIWGLFSDAAGAHLVPTLFVATAFLSQTPDPPRNALIFTGLAAAYAFFVGLRAILLHQLWDRDNDINSGISTFATQFQPESVRFWINRLVFPVEIALFGSVAVLLSRSAPALVSVFVAYVIFEIARLQVTKTPLDPSPAAGKNIIPHELYEVWLPLALATLLASRDPYYLGFVVLTLILFFPSVKNRAMGAIDVIQMLLTAALSSSVVASETEFEAERESQSANDNETEEMSEMPATNVTPLTPEMQRQLETEGYVVLENFLTPDELEDLRELVSTAPLPENANALSNYTIFDQTDATFRQHHSDYLKAIVNPKLTTLLPNHRAAICTWYRKSPNSSTNRTLLHQDASATTEPETLAYGIWSPLMDVDPGNSCLHIIKGSHHLNLKPRSFSPFSPFPYSDDIATLLTEQYLTPIPLKAGQAILYDKRLFHSATANPTDTERVAFTSLICPSDKPTQFVYRPTSNAEAVEIYEVPDDFYNRYILGDKPSGEGVNLIKTEPYTYDPLTPELIAEKLDPLHPKPSTPQPEAIAQYRQTLQHFQEQAKHHIQQLQTQLQQTQTKLAQSQSQLQTTQTKLAQSQSQLQTTQTKLAQSQSQLQTTQTELVQSESQLQTTQTELTQLKSYLQQTQGGKGLIDYYRHRLASNPDDLQLYHQALTIEPNNADLHRQLGNALARQNRFAEAIASYQTALQYQPDNWEIYLELGKVLENEREWEEAIAVYRRAIAFNSEDVRLHQHLGDALAEMGKIDEASTCYRHVLQLTK